MTGVLLNSFAIGSGALLGVFLRRFFNDRMASSIEVGLGYCIVALGLKMALEYNNVVVLVVCVAVGGLIGTVIGIQDITDRFSKRLEKMITSKTGKESLFAQGFSMTSILFCTGAMAIVGAIQSGAANNHEVLIAKSLLDGIISISMAAVYGFGIAMSAIPVFIYQGSIALAASELSILSSPNVLADISGVGGVLLIMIGTTVAKIKVVNVADFIPSLFLVMIYYGFFV